MVDGDTRRRTVMIAGVVGMTQQAVNEARVACRLGYHAGMLSLGALRQASDHELIAHCERVAHEIPLVGFYLQPAGGGRLLSYSFWRKLVEIPNLVMIKIAPFNRYQTLDVLRAVAESGRSEEIALYTGNDDQILLDLLTEFRFQTSNGPVSLNIAGGLLGQWACWTKRAVEILEMVKQARTQPVISKDLLTLAAQLTDANSAIFDVANQYAGAIAGVHEILRRQGLLKTTRCLSPKQRLSPGQSEEIDRVCRSYPQLTDDHFVAEHLHQWLE
jgi:dihydrodipicolinate synthase/N-acetylneuraminate lyase